MDRIPDLEEMYAEDPDDALAGFMLGSEYLKVARAQDALAVFRKVVVSDPEYSAARAGLAQALEALGLVDEARATWGETVVLAERKGDLQVTKMAEAGVKRLGG